MAEKLLLDLYRLNFVDISVKSFFLYMNYKTCLIYFFKRSFFPCIYIYKLWNLSNLFLEKDFLNPESEIYDNWVDLFNLCVR